MVSVIAMYSSDLSSNPAEVFSKFCLKRTEINKKSPGLANLKTMHCRNKAL